MKIYNTLTRKKETFKPVKKNTARIYVCGPTVNDVPHLGHARVQIVFDVLRKYLKFLKYKVKFVSNVTDIEDKIINKANELKISIKELSEKNLKEHLQAYESIGVEKPDVQPKATEYVKEMIELIKKLEKKKYTYVIPEDGVYYDISKFKDYGKLSKFNLEELQTKRKLVSKTKGKKDEKDFVLWKFSKKDEPSWDSPWGKGRPGWHIECSAMSQKILGLPLDIHAGGQDLIFPHHEDEIAQSEAGYGKKFSNYWMHNGMVKINKEKMSKSLGNFKTIKDLLKKYSGQIIRYFIINNHYRKPVDFSEKKLDEAKNSVERLKGLAQNLKDDKKTNQKYLKEFQKNMDNDLNTAGALNVLWKLIRDEKATGKFQTIKEIDKIFGFGLLEKEKLKIPKEVKELLKQRQQARKNKDYKKSDDLREKIKDLGFQLNDSTDGVDVRKI